MGAVVNTLVSVPMTLLMGPVQQRVFQRVLESQPDMPENLRQAFDSFGGSALSVIGIAVGFIMMLVLGAVFASLGGLLGAFFFKKKDAPFQPPPVPVA
jgi:hypothetical protein